VSLIVCVFAIINNNYNNKLNYKAPYGRNFRGWGGLAGMWRGQTCTLHSDAKRKKVSSQPVSAVYGLAHKRTVIGLQNS